MTLGEFVQARLAEGEAEASEAVRIGYPGWRALKRSNAMLRAHVEAHGPSPVIASTWSEHPDYRHADDWDG